MSVLEARKLHCGWGRTGVVRDLSLSVDAGEVVVLVGANGVGKTTTLMTLAGALEPLSGTISIGGAQTGAPLHSRARSGLGFVPEGRGVFNRLTVRDNLRLGRGPVESALELFPDLEPLLGRLAGSLSGGEQQMLRLGRALAGQPKVLLIDELSLGLAPKIVRRLLNAVRAAADAGAAVLVVEQHVRLALGLADRGCVLARGELVLTDGASELARRLPEIEAAYLSTSDVREGGDPSPSTNGRRAD
jgi:branched-chain amino acid transport system ATP-binding protein